MTYPEELLETAQELLLFTPRTQATLRRAVSTAYYALFHLLIQEASSLWSNSGHHAVLSRNFQHKQMKQASERLGTKPRPGSSPEEQALVTIASTFVDLQQRRHFADYNLGVTMSHFSAVSDVYRVKTAFSDWNSIKGGPKTQDYLFSLLFKDQF